MKSHGVQLLFSARWHVAEGLNRHFVVFPGVFDGCPQIECLNQARFLVNGKQGMTAALLVPGFEKTLLDGMNRIYVVGVYLPHLQDR